MKCTYHYVKSYLVEDPAEIKQRLLRLQQKFGYRTEPDETDLAAGFNNIQKRASTLSLVRAISIVFTSLRTLDNNRFQFCRNQHNASRTVRKVYLH